MKRFHVYINGQYLSDNLVDISIDTGLVTTETTEFDEVVFPTFERPATIHLTVEGFNVSLPTPDDKATITIFWGYDLVLHSEFRCTHANYQYVNLFSYDQRVTQDYTEI